MVCTLSQHRFLACHSRESQIMTKIICDWSLIFIWASINSPQTLKVNQLNSSLVFFLQWDLKQSSVEKKSRLRPLSNLILRIYPVYMFIYPEQSGPPPPHTIEERRWGRRRCRSGPYPSCQLLNMTLSLVLLFFPPATWHHRLLLLCGREFSHHSGQRLPWLTQSWVCRAPFLCFGTTVTITRQTYP